MSTSMMIVRLLICTVILVPPYCRGFKNRNIQHLFENGISYIINLTFELIYKIKNDYNGFA